MIRVFLDANVLISGTLARNRPESTLGRIIPGWEEYRFTLVTSLELINEVERNLSRLSGTLPIPTDAMHDFVALLRDFTECTPIIESVVGVATHPEDDLILAASVSADVDVLVTGDKQLLALRTFRGVRIVTPRTFVDEFLET
jgi:putative PIN family toxin of toxin-antitoxin system